MTINLVDLVNKVLSSSVEEVISSTLIRDLLTAYSALYLNGGQPKLCGKCHKKYYYELKNDGIMKAELFEKAKNRTCKPKWNGLKFIPKLARHFNSEILTDEQAIMLLEGGHVKEDEFIKLPKAEPKAEPETEPKAAPKTKKAVSKKIE